MRPSDYLLYAGVVFAWSTSWYPLSLQMGVVEAEVSLVWRFTAAAVLMLAITAWFRVPLRYGRAEHIRFAMLGIRDSGEGYRRATRNSLRQNAVKVSDFCSSLRSAFSVQLHTFSCGFISGEYSGQPT